MYKKLVDLENLHECSLWTLEYEPLLTADQECSCGQTLLLKIKEFVRKTESGENIYLSELYCPIFILENSVNKEEHTLIVGTYNETKKTFNKVNLFD